MGEYDQALNELRAAAKLSPSQLDPSAVDGPKKMAGPKSRPLVQFPLLFFTLSGQR
jgi:hypothetical protein